MRRGAGLQRLRVQGRSGLLIVRGQRFTRERLRDARLVHGATRHRRLYLFFDPHSLVQLLRTIDVLYATMSGGGQLSAGASATIGLASSAGLYPDCCDRACVRSNTGRRYTPLLLR